MNYNTFFSHNTYLIIFFFHPVDKWIIIHDQKQNRLCMPLIFTEYFCLSWFLLASAEQDTMLTGVSSASITWHSNRMYICCRNNMEITLEGRCNMWEQLFLAGKQTDTVTHQSHLWCRRHPSYKKFVLCIKTFAFLFFYFLTWLVPLWQTSWGSTPYICISN